MFYESTIIHCQFTSDTHSHDFVSSHKVLREYIFLHKGDNEWGSFILVTWYVLFHNGCKSLHDKGVDRK